MIKKTFFISITLGIILFSSCEKDIETPQDVINANLNSSSKKKPWESFKTKRSTAIMKTIIGGQEVSVTKIIISKKIPDLQKKEAFINDKLNNIILTQKDKSYFVSFDKGEFKGINSIPTEKIFINKVLELKKNTDNLSLKDTVYDSQASFMIIKNNEERYLFNKESKLLTAYISESSYGKATTNYSDYKEIEGYLLPFKEEINIPKSNYKVVKIYSSIEVNPSFNKDHFKKEKGWVSLTVGQKFPDFQIPQIHNDKLISNNTVKGKVTLIDFWATWCKPCIEEFPNIEKYYKKYKTKGFEVISISVDENKDKLISYNRKKPFSWKYNTYLEGGLQSKIAIACQVVTIPKPILIDENGSIIAVGVNARGEELAKQLHILFGRD